MNIMKNTFQLIMFRKKLFGTFFIFILLFFLSPLGTSLVISEIFNHLQGISTIEIQLFGLMLLLPLTFLVQIVSFVFFILFYIRFIMKIRTLLRKNLMKGILDIPGAEALTDTTGEAISRFRGDVDTVAEMTVFFGQMINFAIFAIIGLSLMFLRNRVVTTAILIPFVILIVAVFVSKKKMTQLHKASRKATGRVTSAINEIYTSVRAIKVSTAESDIAAHFASLNNTRKKATMKDEMLLQIIRSMYGIVASVSIGIMFFLIGEEMKRGNFSVGDIYLFTYLIGWLTAFVGNLGEFTAFYQRTGVSYGRMARMARLNSNQVIQHGEIYINKPFPELIPVPAAESLKLLEVENLSYVYPNSSMGIRNVSFSISPGSFTVITGRIGCGKTTLLRAIQGLVKPEGLIKWNGILIESPTSFFKPPHSSYTPQIPTLFSESIKNNIDMGMPVEEVEIKSAIRLAVIEEDIDQFDEKLETIVGPKGVKLSGGQKQRLAAARMFCRHAELFILDDISSALDINTEQLLWERVFNNPKSSYLITSHRKAVLRQANQIIVLKNGMVEDIGSLDELLVRSKEMQELWQEHD